MVALPPAFLYERVHVFHIDVLAGQGFKDVVQSTGLIVHFHGDNSRFAQR